MLFQKNIPLGIYFTIILMLPGLFFGAEAPSASTKYTDPEWVESFGDKDKIICVTIPKAGTHLLIKCLTLLNLEGITYNYDTPKNKKNRIQGAYEEVTAQEYADRVFSRLSYRIKKNKNYRSSYLVHLPFNLKHKSFFDQFTIANFLMIRDPRDQLISLASTSLYDPTDRETGLERTLLDLLKGTMKQAPMHKRHGACNLVWTLGIVDFYRSYLEWEKEPNFCVVRFENLVGPQGGGNAEAQIEEIKKIGIHLGIELSDEQILHVTDNLYAGTRTYKTGQSQTWKQYFTPKVKKAFKKVPGACQLLIDLDYEKDCDW